MLRVIFTSDYEIHGNGEGSPRALMVETTDRMLALFDRFGARLTIMADVAEILRFRRYRDETGRDDFAVEAILAQLRRAVATGHDVQLHVHPSYDRAEWRDGRWHQDYTRYDLARLEYDALVEIVRKGKEFLESALRPARSDYRCWVFRAANWSMHPSPNIVRALIHNGITVDTSVFKYGRRDGLVRFDYERAWSDVIPWPASATDVCARDPESPLFEVPIYAERRWVGAFLSPLRFYRVLQSRLHRLGDGAEPVEGAVPASRRTSRLERIRRLLGRHSWKLDFNQCTGRQLIAGLRRAAARTRDARCDLPVVLIGHSKLFTRANERSLARFLAFIQNGADAFAFATFADVDFTAIRRAYHSPAGRGTGVGKVGR